MKSRWLVTLVAMGCAACATIAGAQSGAPASAYPHSRVTLVTHSSPGGGSDVFVRELARNLGPVMNVNFAVENVTGGSGARAMAQVAKSPANGSVFYVTTPTYIQTTLLSKPPAGYDALDPLAVIFIDPEVIYTRTESPWKSLSEVIEHARKNPGKSRWGASNPASLERIAMERLARAAKVKVPIVSHDGGADQMINVLNGTFDIGIGEIQELRGQLDAGKVRLLATLSEARLAGFPNLPTAKEQGVDVVVRKFRGLAGPKGVPDDIARTWEAALRKTLDVAAYKKEYARESLLPIMLGRAEARKFTDEFVRDISASLKELGVIR